MYDGYRYLKLVKKPTCSVPWESKKMPNQEKAKLHYKEPDNPNRKKHYGATYTDRQLQILYGELPWETVPLHEISLLVNKAKSLDDNENYERARKLQALKRTQDQYKPSITPGEAKDILKKLTPEKSK